jgi:hypothetical protein
MIFDDQYNNYVYIFHLRASKLCIFTQTFNIIKGFMHSESALEE